MTKNSDGTTIGLDEATAEFIALENYRQLEASIKTVSNAKKSELTFNDLWLAAAYPDQHDDLIAKIQSEKMHADRFAALLRSMAIYNLPAQIAAASGDALEKRVGEQFNLEIKPSSRRDGVYFLIMRFHAATKIIPQHLYYCHNNHYGFVALSSVNNGVSQVMISETNPVIDAFKDTATEFFIK